MWFKPIKSHCDFFICSKFCSPYSIFNGMLWRGPPRLPRNLLVWLNPLELTKNVYHNWKFYWHFLHWSMVKLPENIKLTFREDSSKAFWEKTIYSFRKRDYTGVLNKPYNVNNNWNYNIIAWVFRVYDLAVRTRWGSWWEILIGVNCVCGNYGDIRDVCLCL